MLHRTSCFASSLGSPCPPTLPPIEEANICYKVLTESPASLQPQTREYLKARLYWNAATSIRDGWLDGWHLDFGPVDDAALAGLNPIKDAETTRDVYEAAFANTLVQR
jgi:hypothetical protein